MADPLSHRANALSVADDGNDMADSDPSLAAAEYLGDMIGQLESMARVAGLDLLVYLLSMARVEAETNARMMGYRGRPPSHRT